MKIKNKKPGYFPPIEEDVQLSEHFRNNYKDFLFKDVFLNGTFVEKRDMKDYFVILLRDTGISKDINQTDMCGEHHMWIKCDPEIANKLVKGEDYYFRGKLKPYISNDKLNIGFEMNKAYI